MDILSQDIMYLTGVGPHRKDTLASQLGIKTWGDLMEYYPYKYVDRSKVYRISELTGDMPFVQIKGKILSFETFAADRRQKRIVAHFSDGHGVADLVWFRGGQYAMKTYKVGEEYIVFGKPAAYMGRYQFAHPEIERAADLSLNDMGMQPYYMTTEKMKNTGMTSHTICKLTKTLVSKIPDGALPETLLPSQVSRLHLISREEALRKIHYPRSLDDVQRAQVRLKFEELFYVQLNILRYTSEHRKKYQGYVFAHVGEAFNRFYRDNLTFDLTGAQKRVVHEIRDDLRSGRQMNRLLQGDVGSGKTLVALMAMLLALDNGFQACMMAPTEILAEQHLTTLREFLKGMDVRVELLTGIVKGKRRREVLAGLADGSVDILVGTHAIIEGNVAFRRLGMAVVDEQHRFGVAQRAKLWAKSDKPPHILVMTATPIPRTLAMTIYGDLDVSVIDEMPPGRKPVFTEHYYYCNRNKLNAFVRSELQKGRQCYVVFPLIKENERMDYKNLEAGYEYMKQCFPEYHVCMVHGKLKPADKDAAMQEFVSGQAQIMVATTVIEVGVNVPNASVMIIESAERFGLSQLHQLRGRVGRGADQSYCILMTANELGNDTRRRIETMCATTDGFAIAEADMRLRGPGDIEGTQQSGIPFRLKISDLARDSQILSFARDCAKEVLHDDPFLSSPNSVVMVQRLAELQGNDINWSRIS